MTFTPADSPQPRKGWLCCITGQPGQGCYDLSITPPSMLAGIDTPTCAPTAANLEPDWVTACNALKVVKASECASLWKNFQENAVLAFGPLTAQALNADFQLLASSGSGPSPAAQLCTIELRSFSCCPTLSVEPYRPHHNLCVH